MTSIPPPASAAPIDPRPAEPPRAARAGWITALRWTAAVLLFAWSIVFAAWLVLQWGILPRIDAWRPQLEARATQALGVPVRIGAVAVLGERTLLQWARAVELRDVRLLDPDGGGERLHLPSVRAALSPASLLPGWDGRWRLRFEQLAIEAPSLDVRRERDGRLFVAGLELGRGAGDDAASPAADWFFSQHEFAIRGGTLTWTDALRDAPPLLLRAVDLVVRNGVRRHDLRLDATPPDGWGGRFSLRGRFTQPLLAESPGVAGGLLARPGDWRRWRGTAYAELPSIDLAPLQRHLTLPFTPSAGEGALRVWVELRDARPVSASADLALRGLTVQLAPEAEPLAFARLDGRLSGRFDGQAGELAVERLAFALPDGREWPAGDARLSWRFDAQGALAGGEISAPRLDLGLVAATLGRLPARWVGAGVSAQVASLAPQGIANDVLLRWDGEPSAPAHYRVDARLAGLQLAAAPAEPARSPDGDVEPGRPGLQGADVELHATEAGGRARIVLAGGALELPGVFAEPRVPIERLDGELSWKLEPGHDGAPPRVELLAPGLSFANADAAGRVDLRWTSAPQPGGSGVLELDGRLERADAARVARYLPLQMNAEAREYVGGAVLAGRIRAAEVRLRGDLDRFPFDGAQAAAGEFRFAAQVEGVRYDPAPGPDGDGGGAEWPRLDEVQGELVFDRASLQLRGLQGRLAGVGSGGFAIDGVRGTVADLDADDATLVIEGEGRGPLADALRFVAEAPLGDELQAALEPVDAGGGRQAPAALQLALTLPINDSDRSTVRGRLVLAGNDLRLRPGLPLLADARARIAFSESSFSLADGSARVLGGETRYDGAMQPDGSLRFDIQGQASVEALRRSPELAGWSRAAAPLSGQAAYRLALGITDGRVDARLSSDLAGLAIDLPAPIGKPAAATLPLRVRIEPLPAAAGSAPRERLHLALGPDDAPLLQAAWLREEAADGPRVLRGGIGLFDAAPEPTDGVAASLKLAELDLDAWQRAIETLWPAAADGAAANAAFAPGGHAPSRIALQAQGLQIGDRRLTGVVAGLTRSPAGPDAGLWRITADAAELTGYAEYHPSGVRAAQGAGRVYARLARLSLPKSEADAVSSLLERATPARVPALDIVVEDLELRGKRLGRVEIEARNRDAARGAAGWQLDRLRLVNPDATLAARGEWVPAAQPGAPRRTVLDFELDVADGGALLARLGEAGVVRGAKGRIAGRIDWLGSPLQIDYPSLGGEMKVAIDRGQFLQAEPGIAKLLGVLSLQSLPRRLLLDFRDVFGSGFVFDSLRGDVSVAGGVASTRNLRMRGVQAVVAMEGSADIAQETQDLRVWIVPEIDAGGASLAYAVINPAVGLGAFIAQWLLRRPLAEAGARELHVTGPWADPKVEPVERRPGAPLPAAATEPAAAPAAGPDQETPR